MQAAMELQRGGKPRKRTISTKNILFIVSGAFDKLAESIKKRVATHELGFGAAPSPEAKTLSAYLAQAETQDFIKYGFEPEFIGRVPVRVACNALTADDLAHIMTTSEGSILHQYRDDFQGYGIDFDITPEAILAIAEEASKQGTGARGILTVLEGIFRDFKFELPSTAIKHFEVCTEMIENPPPTSQTSRPPMPTSSTMSSSTTSSASPLLRERPTVSPSSSSRSPSTHSSPSPPRPTAPYSHSARKNSATSSTASTSSTATPVRPSSKSENSPSNTPIKNSPSGSSAASKASREIDRKAC